MNPKQRQAVLVQTLLMTAMFGGAYYLKDHVPVASQVPAAKSTFIPPTLSSYRLSAPYTVNLPDFASIPNIQIKKQLFFDFLQPYIDAKNAEVRKQRQRLQVIITKIQIGGALRQEDSRFLWELARGYDVKTDDIQDPGFLGRLLHRVDVLPPSLVLAQAANESGWGTSRFAQEGNNLFGQWCYSQGCGLVPGSRRSSDNHEVKSFSSIEESVNAYFKNINTFPSYQDLRLIRQALRQKAKPIDGISLTEGLAKYSERGDKYIEDLQVMIKKNNLQMRDRTLYP
jgi:Bax protein